MTAEQIACTGEATYSPEDDKLRLYVGRVPRDEYLALRAEGWTSTPKLINPVASQIRAQLERTQANKKSLAAETSHLRKKESK